jgi:dTDP-4-amino-4,6-dideoxygalactose transaminase
VRVVEDNAQAFGATHHGRPAGSFGDAACLSFFPTKTLGGFGDGGMVATRHADVAARLRMLRTHGWRKKYYPEMVAYNSRLDTLQAALLLVNLPHVDAWSEARRGCAARYRELLAGLPVTLPAEREGDRHVYHQYVIRVAQRDAVAAALAGDGIATTVYYPIALHELAPCAAYAPPNGALHEAERAAAEVLALPMFPTLTRAQQEAVATALRSATVGVG